MASTALFIVITIILVIAGCIACCVMCCCYVLKKGKRSFTRGFGGTHGSTAMTTGGSCVSAETCRPGRNIGGKSVTVVNDPSSIYPNPDPSNVSSMGPPMGPPPGAPMAPQGGYGMPYPSYPMSNPTYPTPPNIYPNTYQSHPPDNPPPYNPYYPQ